MSHVYNFFDKFLTSVEYPLNEGSPSRTFKCKNCYEKIQSDYEKAYNDYLNTSEKEKALKKQKKKVVVRLECTFRSRITSKTSSNLVKHLRNVHPDDLYLQYLDKLKPKPVAPNSESTTQSTTTDIIKNAPLPCTPIIQNALMPCTPVRQNVHMPYTPFRQSAKRLRLEDSPVASPLSCIIDTNIARQMKYSVNSSVQKERFAKLLKMLVKCMLPISIVENAAFREYIEYLDPSFNIPSVYTIKYKGLTELAVHVDNELVAALAKFRYVNIALDLWCDATMRSFIGFVAQGK